MIRCVSHRLALVVLCWPLLVAAPAPSPATAAGPVTDEASRDGGKAKPRAWTAPDQQAAAELAGRTPAFVEEVVSAGVGGGGAAPP